MNEIDALGLTSLAARPPGGWRKTLGCSGGGHMGFPGIKCLISGDQAFTVNSQYHKSRGATMHEHCQMHGRTALENLECAFRNVNTYIRKHNGQPFGVLQRRKCAPRTVGFIPKINRYKRLSKKAEVKKSALSGFLKSRPAKMDNADASNTETRVWTVNQVPWHVSELVSKVTTTEGVNNKTALKLGRTKDVERVTMAYVTLQINKHKHGPIASSQTNDPRLTPNNAGQALEELWQAADNAGLDRRNSAPRLLHAPKIYLINKSFFNLYYAAMYKDCETVWLLAKFFRKI
ncbi:unnamed protein product [Caenorhabditis auriculariae]|uniref:Uncharacterized protein n=1 Tax=Caenorhabditis auriculariae TaxID=2777116 RepID=A0A8S1H602_9PELO|nr:unnamed protein product [Caenorhabditis auriculariae]